MAEIEEGELEVHFLNDKNRAAFTPKFIKNVTIVIEYIKELITYEIEKNHILIKVWVATCWILCIGSNEHC